MYCAALAMISIQGARLDLNSSKLSTHFQTVKLFSS